MDRHGDLEPFNERLKLTTLCLGMRGVSDTLSKSDNTIKWNASAGAVVTAMVWISLQRQGDSMPQETGERRKPNSRSVPTDCIIHRKAYSH